MASNSVSSNDCVIQFKGSETELLALLSLLRKSEEVKLNRFEVSVSQMCCEFRLRLTRGPQVRSTEHPEEVIDVEEWWDAYDATQR